MPVRKTSTPVIDKATRTLYVVASFQDQTRGYFVLHALDLRDGSDQRFGPIANYGAWIHEAHHAAKKDAPSGTGQVMPDA